jgi:hypothetical protein
LKHPFKSTFAEDARRKQVKFDILAEPIKAALARDLYLSIFPQIANMWREFERAENEKRRGERENNE